MKDFTIKEIEAFVNKGFNSVSARLCKSALEHIKMEQRKSHAYERMHQEALKRIKLGNAGLIGANKLLADKDKKILQLRKEINKLNSLLEINKY